MEHIVPHVFFDADTSSQTDILLVSSETGFAPFSQEAHRILTPRDRPIINNILRTMDKQVGATLVQFDDERPVKGLIIATAQRSKIYSTYAEPNFGRPYRDFFYQVHYMVYKLAFDVADAKVLGVTHITGGGSNRYYGEVATIAVEAFEQYKTQNASEDRALCFTGCCINEEHLLELKSNYDQINRDGFRPLEVKEEQRSTRHLKVTQMLSNTL